MSGACEEKLVALHILLVCERRGQPTPALAVARLPCSWAGCRGDGRQVALCGELSELDAKSAGERTYEEGFQGSGYGVFVSFWHRRLVHPSDGYTTVWALWGSHMVAALSELCTKVLGFVGFPYGGCSE